MLKPFDTSHTDGPTRVALSMRFSSDLQNDLSIADQEFQMRREVERLGWVVAEDCVRADYAVSGQSLLGRKGLLELLQLSKQRPRPFDAVMFVDTARFGRRVSDVTRIREEFEFNGVFLYFASDHLDSRQPGFEFAFVFKAVQDQNYVKALGEKIRQVQFARFHAGHVPGGHAYGYRSVPVEDPVRKGPHGRPVVLYCDWEIVEEERKVIVRIFEEYAAGKSYAQIARLLNAEGLRPPQKPRGRKTPSWAKSSIREIVQNTKYKGLFILGKTSQVRDPSTGKMKTIHHPESKWEKKEIPELRIIDEDLWNRVQFQRELKGADAAKAFGGMSRTQTAREYLFSGKLRCGESGADGVCGANMVLVVGNKYGKARYGCADHRGRGTCKNALTIPVGRLEEAFLHALRSKLDTPELREVIYAEFTRQLNARLDAEAREARAVASRRTELQQEALVLEKQLDELLATIKEVGHSSRLSREWKGLEARLEMIEEQLARQDAPEPRRFDERKLREFVNKEAENFVLALTADRVKAREQIRTHVSRITLTPKITDAGRFYEASGDVALFTADEGSLQLQKGESIELQCTFPLQVTLEASRPWRRPQVQVPAGTTPYTTIEAVGAGAVPGEASELVEAPLPESGTARSPMDDTPAGFEPGTPFPGACLTVTMGAEAWGGPNELSSEAAIFGC